MITNTRSQDVFAGDGTSTTFTFSFTVPNTSVLELLYTTSAGTVTIDPNLYSVALTPPYGDNLWSSGGILTFPLSGSPVALGESLTLRRVVPYTQNTEISNQGASYPVQTERALDRLEMQIQQIANTAGIGDIELTGDVTGNGSSTQSINSQSSSYTLVIGDAEKLIQMTNASSADLTVPPNSSVAFSVGTRIDILAYGAGALTVVAGSGVTIRSPLSLLLNGQYAKGELS